MLEWITKNDCRVPHIFLVLNNKKASVWQTIERVGEIVPGKYFDEYQRVTAYNWTVFDIDSGIYLDCGKEETEDLACEKALFLLENP